MVTVSQLTARQYLYDTADEIISWLGSYKIRAFIHEEEDEKLLCVYVEDELHGKVNVCAKPGMWIILNSDGSIDIGITELGNLN